VGKTSQTAGASARLSRTFLDHTDAAAGISSNLVESQSVLLGLVCPRAETALLIWETGTEGSNPSLSANESAMSARFSGATRETLACAGLWTRDAGNPPATSQTPPRRSRSTSDSGSAEATIVASDEVYRSGQIAEATTPSPATRRRFSV
jgi:hypothetical protein